MKYDTGRREAQQHGRGWCKVIQGKAAFQEVCSRVAKFAWNPKWVTEKVGVIGGTGTWALNNGIQECSFAGTF